LTINQSPKPTPTALNKKLGQSSVADYKKSQMCHLKTINAYQLDSVNSIARREWPIQASE